MRIERLCKFCKKKFYAGKRKQLFCSRKCFKQNYYNLKRLDTLSNFPLYRCPKCGESTKLNFDPSKKGVNWIGFKCPWCYQNGIHLEVIISPIDILIIF